MKGKERGQGRLSGLGDGHPGSKTVVALTCPLLSFSFSSSFFLFIFFLFIPTQALSATLLFRYSYVLKLGFPSISGSAHISFSFRSVIAFSKLLAYDTVCTGK